MPIVVESKSNFQERVDFIRLSVATTISSTDDLTDDDITNDGYLGSANRTVARKVSNYAELTGDDLLDLEVAVCKICAADILKSAARPIDLDAATARDRQTYIDILDAIELLLQDAARIVKDLSPTAATTATPYFCVIDPLSNQ